MEKSNRLRGWIGRALCIVAVACARDVVAQEAPTSALATEPAPIAATLRPLDTAPLLVAPYAEAAAPTPARNPATRLEVGARRRSARWPGLIVGALAGGAVGGLLANASDCDFVCGPVIVYSVVGGALAGGALGYVVGRQIPYGPEH